MRLLPTIVVAALSAHSFRKFLLLDQHLSEPRLHYQDKNERLAFTLLLIMPIAVFLIVSSYLKLPAVGLFTFGLFFFIVSVTFSVREDTSWYRDVSMRDEDVKVNSTYLRLVFNLYKHGRLILAVFLFNFYELFRRWRKNKDYYKIKCGIYYRLHRYERIGTMVDSALRRVGFSPTLVNFKTLSLAHRGEVSTALAELKNGLKKSPDNTHLMVSLGYVYWQNNQIDEALNIVRKALDIHPNCPLALRSEAHYLCDEALLRYRKHPVQFQHNLDLARERIEKAWEIKGKGFVIIDHVLGYVHLLRGEYAKAADIFSKCIIKGSHNGSRLHLALIFMIGSSTCYRAEYHLRRAWYDLIAKIARRQGTRRHRFFKLVTKNLTRVRRIIQEKGRIVFNENIIFYHLAEDPVLPEQAVTRDLRTASTFRDKYFRPSPEYVFRTIFGSDLRK